MKKELITGKFQCKKGDFGFVIPEERAYWGGDFFVHSKHFNGAKDGDKVTAMQMERNSGKKPEAKIMEVLTKTKEPQDKKRDVTRKITGVYSGGNGNFGFIDIEGQEKGIFVYGLKKNGARDGDTVEADVIMFKGKEEAIVTRVIGESEEIVTGYYSDNEKFGFVQPDNESGDIFIAGGRKADAKDGDHVECKIIKKGGRRPEGIITKIF